MLDAEFFSGTLTFLGILAIFGILFPIASDFVLLDHEKMRIRDAIRENWLIGFLTAVPFTVTLLMRGWMAGLIAAVCTFALIVSWLLGVMWTKKKLRATQPSMQNSTALEEKVAQLENKNEELSTELENRRVYEKHPTRGRWETIQSVTYGHLKYYPLTDHAKNGKAVGFGVELLGSFLGDRISLNEYPEEDNWKTAIERLEAGTIDLIATPMFATFERSKTIAFSMPLFFSNVGFFVEKEFADANGMADLTLADLLARLDIQPDLKLVSVDQEISEKLAGKYVSAKRLVQRPATTVLWHVFKELSEKGGDLGIFSETFHARFCDHVKDGSVVNVLRSHEILYPVSFAVKLGDYQLVNLLNIRILEFAQSEGLMTKLSEHLVDNLKEDDNIEEKEVYDHFVSQWPYLREE